jgi:hypothetical protein
MIRQNSYVTNQQNKKDKDQGKVLGGVRKFYNLKGLLRYSKRRNNYLENQ